MGQWGLQTRTSLRASTVPRGTWTTSAQLWDPRVGFNSAFFTLKVDHAGRDLQHPSASGLPSKMRHGLVSWSPS